MSLTLSPQEVSDYIAEAGRQAWVVPDIPEGIQRRKIKKVGIIGAGTMGGGISMNFATAGINVTIVETKQEALERGLGVIRNNYMRSAKKGRFPIEEVDERMNRLTGTLDLESIKDCDLVIEAVFEDMELKKKVFTELNKIMKPGAIIATNTSALNIDEIASVTDRPEDVIGLHFFSPANVMKLLEIVRANHTAHDVISTCMELARTINKVGVLVGVCPGFVGNRILYARQSQAHKLVYEGVMPWDIDAAINAFGFRMGPYQMSDLAGLDIGWKPGAKTSNPIRDRLCEGDRRGQKTGAGYYDYDENRRPIPSDVTKKIIQEITGKTEESSISADEIVARCIHPMINEGLKILEEGKAIRASDIDIVWINGYNWPVDKGGPMLYGDIVGAKTVLATMEKISASSGEFKPAASLQTLASEGGRFIDIASGSMKSDLSKPFSI